VIIAPKGFRRPWDWFGAEYSDRRQRWLDRIADDPRLSPAELGAAYAVLRAIDRVGWGADSIELPERYRSFVNRLTAYGYMTNLFAALR